MATHLKRRCLNRRPRENLLVEKRQGGGAPEKHQKRMNGSSTNRRASLRSWTPVCAKRPGCLAAFQPCGAEPYHDHRYVVRPRPDRQNTEIIKQASRWVREWGPPPMAYHGMLSAVSRPGELHDRSCVPRKSSTRVRTIPEGKGCQASSLAASSYTNTYRRGAVAQRLEPLWRRVLARSRGVSLEAGGRVGATYRKRRK